MTRRETFVNDASTALDGSINDSVTSVVVDDGSVFPSEGDFRVLCEDEIMLVTSRSSNTLTVVRGSESTTAASHSNAITIKAVLTAQNLLHYMNQASGVKQGQVSMNVGTRYPYRLLDSSGNTLTASSFTWVNQGTSSVADNPTGGLTVTVNETTGDHKLLVKSLPTPPYDFYAHLEFGPGNDHTAGSTPGTMGIGFRDSSSGRFQIGIVQLGKTIAFQRWTSPTTFSANSATMYAHEFDWNEVWLRFEDDNTDIKMYLSQDGVRWHYFGEDTRTAYVATPDQLVFALDPAGTGSADRLLHINAWIED